MQHKDKWSIGGIKPHKDGVFKFFIFQGWFF